MDDEGSDRLWPQIGVLSEDRGREVRSLGCRSTRGARDREEASIVKGRLRREPLERIWRVIVSAIRRASDVPRFAHDVRLQRPGTIEGYGCPAVG
jgi:hypothetical protein